MRSLKPLLRLLALTNASHRHLKEVDHDVIHVLDHHRTRGRTLKVANDPRSSELLSQISCTLRLNRPSNRLLIAKGHLAAATAVEEGWAKGLGAGWGEGGDWGVVLVFLANHNTDPITSQCSSLGLYYSHFLFGNRLCLTPTVNRSRSSQYRRPSWLLFLKGASFTWKPGKSCCFLGQPIGCGSVSTLSLHMIHILATGVEILGVACIFHFVTAEFDSVRTSMFRSRILVDTWASAALVTKLPGFPCRAAPPQSPLN